MDEPQEVFFRHKQTAEEFTILHLPGILYAGHERVMSDNPWGHMVEPLYKNADPVKCFSGEHGVLQAHTNKCCRCCWTSGSCNCWFSGDISDVLMGLREAQQLHVDCFAANTSSHFGLAVGLIHA